VILLHLEKTAEALRDLESNPGSEGSDEIRETE